jgi:omega-6 fatty acid desaturase (delta-12 desaturase)
MPRTLADHRPPRAHADPTHGAPSRALDPALLQQLPGIVRAYQRPDDRQAALQLANSFLPYLALWATSLALLEVSVWLAVAASLLNTAFLTRIFIIQHDCGHQSFTAHRRLNEGIGQLCSLLSFIPYRYWNQSHRFHHRHHGLLCEQRDIGEIFTLTVREFAALGRFAQWRYRLFRSAPVLFVFGPPWYLLVQNRLPLVRLPGWEGARRSLLRHDLALLVLWGGIGLGLGWEALVFVQLPALLGFALTAMWFFYVQHQHEHGYRARPGEWNFVQAAIQGSSHYRLPRVVNWITGDIGYHHLHHLNPLVPNYELARCQRENPVLAQVSRSMDFRQSLRCIAHALWDEDQHRMVSFREWRRRQSAHG